MCKQLIWLGIGKEGVEMDSVWGVEKDQMNGPAQMAFIYLINLLNFPTVFNENFQTD